MEGLYYPFSAEEVIGYHLVRQLLHRAQKSTQHGKTAACLMSEGQAEPQEVPCEHRCDTSITSPDPPT